MLFRVSVDLDSMWAKLDRSREHAQTIKDEASSWFDKYPYSCSVKPNDDYTRYGIIVNIKSDPPVKRWSLMFADSIHNLRCALDYLIYAIAIHESGGQDPPPNADALQFPICDSNSSFANSNTQRRIKTLSDPVRAAIEAMQPYNRPHHQLPPPLALLRDFANMDKHKLLQLVYTTFYKGELDLNIGNHPPDAPVTFKTIDGEVKDGAEIAAYVFDRPAPNVKLGEYNLILLLMLRHRVGPINNQRTDFAKLITVMTNEVLDVIDKVVAAVKR
jgi:hypothetical protein